MIDHEAAAPWDAPGWMEEAHAWIHQALAARGTRVSGPPAEQHRRPWSLVLRVPTPAGLVYFKAAAPAFAHEPALAAWLAARRPDCIAPVLATEPARGWMLMPDYGPMLRSVLTPENTAAHWERILPLYAGVQIALAGQTESLLALGALDRRLSTLPAQFAALLADPAGLPIGGERGLTADEHGRLQALGPRVADECAALAALGIPESLNNEDFHDGNIFLGGGRYLFSDWAEAAAAHPFFTLVVTLGNIEDRLGWEENAPESVRFRDAYLAPWADFGLPATLRAAFALAQRLGMICRALTWHRATARLGPAEQAEHGWKVAAWLQNFLAAEEAA